MFFNTSYVLFRNTIIAHNQLGAAHPSLQCSGTLSTTVGGVNLQSPASADCIPGIMRADPLLDPVIADHGGPLPTFALLPGSPAINAGSGCAPRDQRGMSRIGGCDLGVFEYVAPAFLPITRRRPAA